MGELVAKQKRIAELENRHRNMTRMAVIGSSPGTRSPASKSHTISRDMHAQQLVSPTKASGIVLEH